MVNTLAQKRRDDKAERKAFALKQIWRETHRDYKGTVQSSSGKIKTIMVLRNGGSTLVPLSQLTDAEIASRVKGYEA